MGRQFMAARSNRFRQFRVLERRFADHMRGDLDAGAIPQVEHPPQAFLVAIIKPGLRRQIRITLGQRRAGERTFRAFGLTAGFELHRHRDHQLRTVRPRAFLSEGEGRQQQGGRHKVFKKRGERCRWGVVITGTLQVEKGCKGGSCPVRENPLRARRPLNRIYESAANLWERAAGHPVAESSVAIAGKPAPTGFWVCRKMCGKLPATQAQGLSMDRYAPRNWQPHEKPSLPGSPSTPLHSNPKRLAYALVGLLVAVTGGLGNSLVVANLPYLQGALGATTAEMAWLPAAYVMTNVSMNLLLVKFRQQFGLRAFTEVFLVLYALVTFGHLFVNDLNSAIAVRAAHGMVGAALSSLGLYYMIQAFPAKWRLKALVLGLGLHNWRCRWRACFPKTCCKSPNGVACTCSNWAWPCCRWAACCCSSCRPVTASKPLNRWTF